MWGQYYMCEGCGFTAEDDDELKPKAAGEPLQTPTFLVTGAPGIVSRAGHNETRRP
jgi:hypothetical protein